MFEESRHETVVGDRSRTAIAPDHHDPVARRGERQGRVINHNETVVARPEPQAIAIITANHNETVVAGPDPQAVAFISANHNETVVGRPEPQAIGYISGNHNETVLALASV